MNNNNINLTIGYFLLGVLLFFVVTYDRNILVTYHLIGKENAVYIVPIVFLMLATVFTCVSTIRGQFSFLKIHRPLVFLLLLASVYFLAHELLIGNQMISAKYSMLLLLLCIALGVRKDYYFIFKAFAIVGVCMSLIILSQQALLLFIENGSLSSFSIAIYGDEIGRWKSCDFVNPYGIGYFERCTGEPMNLFGIQFNRSLLFSREPKYISSVLLITMASALVSKSSKKWKIRILILHLFSLLFVMSFTAFAAILVSVFLLYVRLNPLFFVFIAFLLPLIILPLVSLVILKTIEPSNMIDLRLISAASSFGEGLSTKLSLLGTGVTQDLRTIEDTILYKIYGQYGVVGFILCITLFYFFVKDAFIYNFLHFRDKLTSYGLLIFVTSVLFFNLYFFSDIFNFYFIFSVLALLFIPTNMRVIYNKTT